MKWLRWLLGRWGTTQEQAPAQTYCVEASQVFTPGAIRGEAYMVCVEAFQAFAAGCVEGEASQPVEEADAYIPGQEKADAYIPGAEKTQGGCCR